MSANRNLIIKPEAVRSLRKRSGNTQESLAKQVGISIRNMKKIESSGRTRLHTAEKIADAVGASLDVLMGKDAPILSNFWLQTAYGENAFLEPGVLFPTDIRMLLHIHNEVEERLPVFFWDISGPNIQADKKSDVSGRFTTLTFYSTSENQERITYRFAKMTIVDGEGIFTADLTEFEREFHEVSLRNLLSDTTTCYQFDGETVGSQAYFRISIYRADLKNTPIKWEEIDRITLEDIYQCKYVVHQVVDHYNPFQSYLIALENPVQVVCDQLNGERLAIVVGRCYHGRDDVEETAPFPSKWKDLLKVEHKHDKSRASETISLSVFDEAAQSDLS